MGRGGGTKRCQKRGVVRELKKGRKTNKKWGAHSTRLCKAVSFQPAAKGWGIKCRPALAWGRKKKPGTPAWRVCGVAMKSEKTRIVMARSNDISTGVYSPSKEKWGPPVQIAGAHSRMIVSTWGKKRLKGGGVAQRNGV